MAQFDIHENANPQSKKEFPYLLILQTDLLEALATVMVAPLATKSVIEKPLQHLNPVTDVSGEPYLMVTQEMAGILKSSLGKYIGSANSQRGGIINAIDFIFTGI